MKKRITLLLLSALLLTNLTACNTAPKKDVESTFEDTNSTESTVEETEEETTTEKEDVDPSTLTYFNRQDADFAKDQYGQWYAYVPAWDTYFQASLQGVPRDALISGDHLWIMSSSEDGSHIATYKFSKDGTLIESYSSDLPFKASDSWAPQYEYWFYNCYQENSFYAFFLEYNKSVALKPTYVMYQFQSTDCGKTWVQTEGYQAEFSDDDMWVSQFFSHEIGIVCTRFGERTLKSLAYVTFDGGGTWTPMDDLPYPAEWGVIEEFFVQSVTYENDEYVFTLRILPREGGIGDIYVTTFVCNDFVNWSLREYHRILPE